MYYWKWPNVGTGNGSTVYNFRWALWGFTEPLANDPNIPGHWNNHLQWLSSDGGTLQMLGFWDETLYESAKAISTDEEYLKALDKLWNRLLSFPQSLTVDFGSAQYNWNVMRDQHWDWTTGNGEVSELCYHAGVSVGMEYGIKGSSASSKDVDNALRDHFRYEARHSGRNIGKMIEEIQWLRPVQLCGYRKKSKDSGLEGKVGHCWVVFGYKRSTNQFNMNMGGGGSGDNLYTVDNAGYPIDQDIVFGIAPRDRVKFIGDDDSGNGSPSDPYKNIEEAIAKVPNDAVLIFKAGSVNTFSASTLTINRRLTLKGKDVTICKK
jgi:hypothetical protein